MANEYNRENMITAIEDHAKGHIAKHKMNVEVYLKNAAGETKEKLIATKNKLSENSYTKDGFFKELSKMVELRKSLLI